MNLAEEQYVVVTTFTRDGTPKPTPVWPVDAGDGRVGFITASDAWKVKRLANNSRVEVQPSDARGRPKAGSTTRSGTAQVVDGSGYAAVHDAVRTKYGFKLTMINAAHAFQRLFRRSAHLNDCAVIITLDEH